jgi:transcriptional/translational regulatory protein YebC/TACO1
VSVEDARAVNKLISKLEEYDDVDEVYTNMELSEEVAAAIAED